MWSYPRPPRVEAVRRQVEVIFGGKTLAVTLAPLRVLETSHPPSYYLPPDAVFPGTLVPSGRTTRCEFKGTATHLTVMMGRERAEDGAWTYLDPSPGYEALAGYVAFHPGRMEVCLVDGDMAMPQAGGYYGGWITSEVVGPFKGEPGTEGW